MSHRLTTDVFCLFLPRRLAGVERTAATSDDSRVSVGVVGSVGVMSLLSLT